jgi:hypothetical protein
VGIRVVYRGNKPWRAVALSVLAAIGIMAASGLLLMVLPPPHGRIHYLIAGTAPVIAGLIALRAHTERLRTQPRAQAVRRGSTVSQ